MQLTLKQKDKIIAQLEKLWRLNWDAPITEAVAAMKEALSLVTPYVNERLRKFGLGGSVKSERIAVKDEIVYNRDVQYSLDPIYCAYIKAHFSLGRHGYPFEISVSYDGSFGLNRFYLGNVIWAATGDDRQKDLRTFVYSNVETNGSAIVQLKNWLENPPEDLFRIIASLPGKFSDLVHERLELCDKKENENNRMLLDAFGLKSKGAKKKRTVFKVIITKEEVEC